MWGHPCGSRSVPAVGQQVVLRGALQQRGRVAPLEAEVRAGRAPLAHGDPHKNWGGGREVWTIEKCDAKRGKESRFDLLPFLEKYKKHQKALLCFCKLMREIWICY